MRRLIYPTLACTLTLLNFLFLTSAISQTLPGAAQGDRLQQAGIEGTFTLYEKHGARWRVISLLRECGNEGIANAMDLPLTSYHDAILETSIRFGLKRDEVLPLAFIIHNGIRWYMAGMAEGAKLAIAGRATDHRCKVALGLANKMLEEEKDKRR